MVTISSAIPFVPIGLSKQGSNQDISTWLGTRVVVSTLLLIKGRTCIRQVWIDLILGRGRKGWLRGVIAVAIVRTTESIPVDCGGTGRVMKVPLATCIVAETG